MRPRLKFVAALAALFSVVLHAFVAVHAAGMSVKPAPGAGDPDALAWLAQTGGLICHGAPTGRGETPDHPAKSKIGPCLICSGLQAAAAPADEIVAACYVAVAVPLDYRGGPEQAARDAGRKVFQPRGPPAQVA